MALEVLKVAIETWWAAVGAVFEGLEIRRRPDGTSSEVYCMLELLRAARESKEDVGREKEGYSRHVGAVSVAFWSTLRRRVIVRL